MKINGWAFLNFAESKGREIMEAYYYFYYIKDHFLLGNNLITLPKTKILAFIQADKEISPIHLHEHFRGGKFHALFCIQFLCTLKIHLQGDPELFRDTMNEFYHNISMQALSQLNSDMLLNFNKISDLVININYLLQ